MPLNFLTMSGIDPKVQVLCSDIIHGVQNSLTAVISTNLKKDIQEAGYMLLCVMNPLIFLCIRN